MDTYMRPQESIEKARRSHSLDPLEQDANDRPGAPSGSTQITLLRSEENDARQARTEAPSVPGGGRDNGSSSEIGTNQAPPTILLLAEEPATTAYDNNADGEARPGIIGLEPGHTAPSRRAEPHPGEPRVGRRTTSPSEREHAPPDIEDVQPLPASLPRATDRDKEPTEAPTQSRPAPTLVSPDNRSDDQAPTSTEALGDGGFHIPPTRELDFVSVRHHWISPPATPTRASSGPASDLEPIGPTDETLGPYRSGQTPGDRPSGWWTRLADPDGSFPTPANRLEIGALRLSASDASEISVQRAEPRRWRERLTSWFRPGRHTGGPRQPCEHAWQPGWDDVDRPIMRCIRCNDLDATRSRELPTTPPGPGIQADPGPLWRPADRGQAISALLDHAALKHRTYRRPPESTR